MSFSSIERSKARVRISAHDIAEILASPAWLLAGARNFSRAEQAAAQIQVREIEDKRLSPQLTTWYRRQSLRDASGGVRVTLDTELAFCHPIDLGVRSDGALPVLPPRRLIDHALSCLLEVKCQGALPAWLERAMATLGDPPATRLSKYAMGMHILMRQPAA